MRLSYLGYLLAAIWQTVAVVAQIHHSVLLVGRSSRTSGSVLPTDKDSSLLSGAASTRSWTTVPTPQESMPPVSSPTMSSSAELLNITTASDTLNKRQDVTFASFTEHNRVCNNEKDFKGHADINPAMQYEGCSRFCKSEKGKVTLSRELHGSPPYPAARYRHKDRNGINHDFKVEWKRGCKTTQESQSILGPLGMPPDGPGCVDLMRANYEKCKVNPFQPICLFRRSGVTDDAYCLGYNGGVGGSIQVGCLVFTYDGGRGGMF